MEKRYSLYGEFNFKSILIKTKESNVSLKVVFILSIIIIEATVLASNVFEIPYSDFLRDPVVVLNGEFYVGWFSQLGVMFWSIAAGFCFVSAKLVSSEHPIPNIKGFLYYSFFLTLFLGMDDIFMFHDEIFPLWGVHENIFIFSYMIIVSLYLIIYFKVVLKTEYILMGLAYCFFALSILLDKIPHKIKIHFPGGLESVMYEDGAKMIGILLWMVYFYSVAKLSLKDVKVPEKQIAATY
ncbi:hypothetical protein [Shivajiella indica]|uniref:DUF998 domain-containing protein n=1 Tax=Shivajiella indica TaxID=872115 RepID=A0ABW5B4U9_9BACT